MANKRKIEPIPEDWERARQAIANSREQLMERLVMDQARQRVEAEERERRRPFLRRLFPFRRTV